MKLAHSNPVSNAISLLAAAFALGSAGSPALAESLHQDFESGIGGWFVDNGVWEVGTPAGAPGCHGGSKCAGTVLDGSYPFTASRLISTPVQLDNIGPGQLLSLRFWHWFSWASSSYGPDHGYVQVSTFDPTGGWSAWVNVSPAIVSSSGVWTEKQVDLTPYAGQLVRIGFNHVGNVSRYTAQGWYIDDVHIPGATCTAALSLAYSSGTLRIEATNGTTEPGTWSLSVAKGNRVSRLQSQPIDVTDPPKQTLVTIPDFRPSGEVGVLSRISVPGKGIACSVWRTVDTSLSP